MFDGTSIRFRAGRLPHLTQTRGRPRRIGERARQRRLGRLRPTLLENRHRILDAAEVEEVPGQDAAARGVLFEDGNGILGVGEGVRALGRVSRSWNAVPMSQSTPYDIDDQQAVSAGLDMSGTVEEPDPTAEET